MRQLQLNLYKIKLITANKATIPWVPQGCWGMIYLTLWPHCVWSTGWGIWSCSGTPPIWYQHPVQRKRIVSNKSLFSTQMGGVTGRPVSSTYIRTDSINAIGYFWEGIIQCWDICDNWFFIWRLNVYVWWGEQKPKSLWMQHMSCTQRNYSSSQIQVLLSMIYSTESIFQTKHDTVHWSHPRGPGAWPPPAAQLHKTHAPDLIGWSVMTHGSCQPCPACDRRVRK